MRAAVERSPRRKRAILRDVLAAAPDPALVFTAATATAHELGAWLGCAVATSRDGRGAIDAFRRGRVAVLVTTDLASEGLNLQCAGLVVHYDIPWNPVRLDQRNGRIHRIGQVRDTVRAVYFLPERDRSHVVAAVSRKNRLRRRLVVPRNPLADVPGTATLRPRLTAGSAAVRFVEALERRGIEVPEFLERAHRAGVERMLEDADPETIGGAALERLLALAAAER